jgi:hypothetical protein
MPRSLKFSLLLLGLVAAPHVLAQDAVRVEIVEWGLYRSDLMGKEPSPEGPSGTRNIVDNVRLQQATTTVPALVGMKFGYRYKVVGGRLGSTVRLKHVTRFPKQGVTNPASGKTYVTDEYHGIAFAGLTLYRGYSLDHDWEVETGPWTLEIWHEDRKLAEKTFMVTRLVSSAR